MNSTNVKMPENIYNQIKEEIKANSPNEACMFLIAKKIKHALGVTYSVTKLIMLEKTDIDQSPYRCALEPEATSEIFTWYLREQYHKRGFVPIYVHSHPFEKNSVSFSSIDFKAMKNDRMTLYDKYFGDMDNLWIVFNESATKFDGRVVKKGGDFSETIDELTIYGEKFKKILLQNSDFLYKKKPLMKKEKINFYRRMLLIPGLNVEELKNIRIGIIGLGGNGASLLQGLLMTGIGENKELILIDHDIVEDSNLSRIPYATPDDIGKYKVDVASEYVKKIRPIRKVAKTPSNAPAIAPDKPWNPDSNKKS
jgi:proteasome lid subunit RPN8/RPN11